MTSTVPPAVISRQLAHTPQGVAVGPLTQFRQRARMRATVVLPVPRWPGKDVAVRDALLRDGVFQRGLDVFLVDHVRETSAAGIFGR